MQRLGGVSHFAKKLADYIRPLDAGVNSKDSCYVFEEFETVIPLNLDTPASSYWSGIMLGDSRRGLEIL